MLQISFAKQVMIWLTVVVGLTFAMPNAFYTRVETHNDAMALIEAGQTSAAIEADAALWPSFLPSGLVNLGLDLRGGAHLLVEVQVEDVHASFLEGFWPQVRDVLAAERDVVGFVTREDGPDTELRVRISQTTGAARALELVRGLGRPVNTFTGGVSSNIDVRIDGPILTITLSEAEILAMDDRTMAQSLEIIRRRVDLAGTREPTIQRQGAERILVQVPGVGS